MQGDFEAFYLRHFKAIYRVCYAFMKNAQDTEDCTELALWNELLYLSAQSPSKELFIMTSCMPDSLMPIAPQTRTHSFG